MDGANITLKDSLSVEQTTDRETLAAALKTLLASPEAQARIGSVHKDSESNVEAILPTDDLDKCC